MVFAAWAGRKHVLTPEVREAFLASWRWGRDHVDEMVDHAAAERGFQKDLVRAYFTRHIVYPLTPRHLEGLALFRKLVMALDAIPAPV
jgi:predicted solute-binding protein